MISDDAMTMVHVSNAVYRSGEADVAMQAAEASHGSYAQAWQAYQHALTAWQTATAAVERNQKRIVHQLEMLHDYAQEGSP